MFCGNLAGCKRYVGSQEPLGFANPGDLSLKSQLLIGTISLVWVDGTL